MSEFIRVENMEHRTNGLTYFDGVTADGSVVPSCLPRKEAKRLLRQLSAAEPASNNPEESINTEE